MSDDVYQRYECLALVFSLRFKNIFRREPGLASFIGAKDNGSGW